MTCYSHRKIMQYFLQGDDAETDTAKGQALENLVCYLFQKIPGVSIDATDGLNVFGNDQFDVLLWNKRQNNGLYFLPCSFIAECKNWAHPVGSRVIDEFQALLRSRGCDHGVLVSSMGISGNNNPPTEAYHKISDALLSFFHILVITRGDIEVLATTDDVVRLLQKRLGGLKRSGTFVA